MSILLGMGVGVDRGGWSVASVPGVEYWFDCEQLTGYSDGDPVNVLTDFSLYGNHANPDGDGNRGTYKVNQINGLPAVYFTRVGQSQYKINKNMWSAIEGSIYAVVYTLDLSPSDVVVCQGTGVADDFIMLVGANNWGYTDPGGYIDGIAVGTKGGGDLFGAWLFAALHFGSNLGDIYRNNVSLAADVDLTGAAVPAGDGKTRISGFYNFAENNHMLGYMAEVIMCTQCHHEDEHDALIVNYLMGKYGL